MEKVILITNIPNPYRVPLFNELNHQMKEASYSFKVIFASSGYKRRYFSLQEKDFKFPFEILNGGSISNDKNLEKTYFLYKGLWSLLHKENPDKIIVSGFSIATTMVMFYCFFHKTKYIIWSGSIEKETRNSSLLRKIQRKILSKFASGFVTYGKKAKEYLQKRGVSESKISIAINTVDTDYFYSETLKLRKNNSTFNNQLTFTYLGYLVPRKNVHLLLETVKIVSQKRKDFQLDILGEGPSKEDLIKYVKENNLESIVKFHGFKQKEELPAYFAKSNGLLFQTDFDIWGLVLNEAMAAGLTCLASENAGATSDLIQDGINGYIVDYKDLKSTSSKIEYLLNNPAKAIEMGQRASEFIRTNANLQISAKGFLNALKSINR